VSAIKQNPSGSHAWKSFIISKATAINKEKRQLAWEEARTLLQAPNPHSIRGMRDRALLAVLVTCALRRGELSRMNREHLTMRDGR
jgi:integrase/recombinase XerD